MMDLAFQPSARRRAVKEIPVPTCIAVVTPMRNGGHVTENRVDRDLAFVIVPEIFRPRVNFFLPGGIPGHLAAERIRASFPDIRAPFHDRFELVGFLFPTFTP